MTIEQALGSRYVLEERIGSSDMGEVWRGWDLAADQLVAVKVLHERPTADPAELTRFLGERTILTGLDHPNLVRVRDMVMEGSRLVLVMDLVEGPDMHHYLRAHGPLAPALAAALISQACEGLAVVHAAGIVHRGLKPSNILLDTSQSPPIARLTDFGIARAEDTLPLTANDVTIGRPQYGAPEVVAGERGGPAVDIYAAGITLYELLAGRPPFAGGPAAAGLRRHREALPLRRRGIPEPLWTVIAGCLAEDPDQRPSATTAARLLRDCLPALRDAPPAPAASRLGSARFSTVAGAATVLTAGAGLAIAAWLASSYGQQAPGVPAGSRTSASRVSGSQSASPEVVTPSQFNGIPPASPTRHARATGPASPRTPSSSRSDPNDPSTPATSGPAGSAVVPAPASSAPHSNPASAEPAPQPSNVLLYSFEDGTTDGWQAGSNVALVTAASTFPNGPGHPYDGNYALEAWTNVAAPVSAPRSMSVTPASPLNLSAARSFFVAVNGYGGAPGATGYTMTITLRGGNEAVTTTASMQPNVWTKLVLPISTWSDRGQINGISVTFAGVGSTAGWAPQFQIDDVGYTT